MRQSQNFGYLTTTIGKNACIIGACIDPFTFPVRGIGAVYPVMVESGIGMSVIGYAIGTTASLRISDLENHKLSVERPLCRFECPRLIINNFMVYGSVAFDLRTPVAQG